MQQREIVLRWQPQEHQVIPQGNWHTCVLLAGRGAGKTWNATRWLLTQAITYSGITCVAAGRTWSEALRILAEGEGGLRWHIMGDPDNPDPNKQRPNLEFLIEGGSWDKGFMRSPGLMELRLSNGSVIRLASADRPNSLRGTNAHLAIADEVAFWEQESLTMLRLAVRLPLPDGSPARVLMATTPAGHNWWAKEWLDRSPMPGVVYVAGSEGYKMPPDPPPSSYTNQFTDEVWRQNLAMAYDGTDLYQQEVLGLVLSVRGLIYKGLSYLQHTRRALSETNFEWPTPTTYDDCIAGQDLGTEHPSALVVLAKRNNRWCVVDEVVQPAPTEDEWYKVIKPVLDRWNPRVIFSDRNFPQTTNAQKVRGLPIRLADKRENSVVEGIRCVQALISDGNIAFDVDKAPKLWDELHGYKWSSKQDGSAREREQPVKKNDDACDALRYAIFMTSTLRSRKLLFS